MPLDGAGCKLRRCEAVQARVWSSGVVVDLPCFDDPARFSEVGEEMFVEALVAQPAIEGLDEAVLRWFAGCDVVPFHAAFLLPSVLSD